ncbi:D-alanine--D-alanine ligase [bacterium]|nr:D-alanine--D-alanine ligase [bacterium]
MKIGVLMGGTSSEREISLETGKAIVSSLKRLKHSPSELVWNELELITKSQELMEFEVVFIAYHGTLGEDGHVQSVLDMLGVPYTGSGPLTSAIGMNKIISRKLFTSEGIAVPPGMELHRWECPSFEVIDQSIRDSFCYPVVVKPSSQGSTVGINVIESSGFLEGGIVEAFKYDDDILIEKFIPGREFTISFLGDQILPVVEIIPSHGIYDYTCKYTKGGSRYICPAEIDNAVREKLQYMGRKAFKAIGCSGYGRADFRFDGENCYCLEVNTLPGMTELSLVPMAARAKGIDFDQLIDTILNLAHGKRKT